MKTVVTILHAHVQNGRVVVDEPTDLPDGVKVNLLLLDGVPDMEPDERAASVASAGRGPAEADRGGSHSVDELLGGVSDVDVRNRAEGTLKMIRAALPTMLNGAFLKPAAAVGDDGAFLLEWTAGRRRAGIGIERNPAESGWYFVSLDPDAPGSASGSMKDLDVKQLFAKLVGVG